MPPHVPPSLGTSGLGVALLGAGRREDEEGWGSPLTPCTPPSWVQEFLNEENKGLDVLLEYLAFAQCSVAYVPTTSPFPKALRPQGWDQPPPGAPRGRGGSLGLLSPITGVMELRTLPWLRWSGASPTPPCPRPQPWGLQGGLSLPVSRCHISPVPVSPRATRYDMESAENGSPGSDKGKVLERSLEDLNKSSSSSPTQGSSKVRHLTVR